jgi:hypothetical protein
VIGPPVGSGLKSEITGMFIECRVLIWVWKSASSTAAMMTASGLSWMAWLRACWRSCGVGRAG